MSTQSAINTISRLPSPGGSVAGSPSDSDTQFSVDHNVVFPAQESPLNVGSKDQPSSDDSPMPRTYRFAPFDEHLNDSTETPSWQKDLDDHFLTVFTRSALSECSIDGLVAQALGIIGSLSHTKIRGLALTIYMHWVHLQFRSKDLNASAPEIIALISRIADHLGRISVHAKGNFLDELNRLCIEKLRLTWHWYVAVVMRKVLPIPRDSLFIRMMAIVAMIGHLFRGGQLRHSVALNSLRYVATMLPWPDAIGVIYGLLYVLGPKFALEQAGGNFIQGLLAELFPLTVGRAHVDPLRQLISAVDALVAEWRNRTRVTLYYTHPKPAYHE